MQTDVPVFEIDALRDAGQSLTAELLAAAESLERAAVVPARELLDRLNAHVASCREVGSRVQRLAGRVLRTLSDAKEALESVAAARDAEPWLAKLVRVQCDGANARQALQSIQQQAADLLVASDAINPAAFEALQALASGRHVWCDLVRLVDRDEPLDDAVWGECLDRVDQQLGRDIGVAVARGRLSLPRAVPVPVSPPPGAPTADASIGPPDPPQIPRAIETPPVILEVVNAVNRAAEDPAPVLESSTSIFDDIGLGLPTDEHYDNVFSRVERRVCAVRSSGTAQELITPAPRIRSAEDVTGLAWKLVDQGYPGLAAELCHAGGALYPQVASHLPDVFESWLAARGTPPGGQASERLEVALTRLRERHGSRLGAVLTTAESLLLAAAVMRVVVDAPQSVATGILKSLPLLNEHPDLFNFASRLVALCEQLDEPLASRAPHNSSVEDQRRALRRRVESWWRELRSARPLISRTDLLISKAHWSLRPRQNQAAREALQEVMQHLATLRVIHECLKPIAADANDPSAAQRGGLARLKSRLLDADATASSDVMSDGLPTIADHLRSAIGFLECWAKLEGRSPGVDVRLLPEAVEALMDDLSERSGPVADELRSIVAEQRGRPLGTAAVCCLEALAVVMRGLSGGSAAPDELMHETSGLVDELRVAGLADLTFDSRSPIASRGVIDSLAERLPRLPPRRRATDLFLTGGGPGVMTEEDAAHAAEVLDANPTATSILFDFE
jgi:hypothetical protein